MLEEHFFIYFWQKIRILTSYQEKDLLSLFQAFVIYNLSKLSTKNSRSASQMSGSWKGSNCKSIIKKADTSLRRRRLVQYYITRVRHWLKFMCFFGATYWWINWITLMGIDFLFNGIAEWSFGTTFTNRYPGANFNREDIPDDLNANVWSLFWFSRASCALSMKWYQSFTFWM